ncbi:MAG: LuxR C-terminal-related transcriptional regulator [Thermomicrobiales bacterium]
MLLTAPAGWGKTSAAAEWAWQTSLPVAWCQLEGHSYDAMSMLRRMVESLDGCMPGTMDDVLPVVRTAETANLDRAVTLLDEALRTTGTDMVIVLDDAAYDGDGVELLIDILLDSLSEGVHLLITSRAAFPRPISRLRLHGEVGELGADDLRMQDDEVARFWESVLGDPLAPEDVAATLATTEGWAAGLGLMALAAIGVPDVSALIRSYGGMHRDVASYLSEEVFTSQPRPVLELLAVASLIGPFTPSGCDEVLGRNDSADLLGRLGPHNPFLVPLDDRGEWVRIHRMVGEYLRLRTDLLPNDLSTARRRAGRWLLRAGMIEAAYPHFAATGDIDGLLDAFEQIAARPILPPDLAATALDVADHIPIDQLRRRPVALRFCAWLLVRSGRLDEATDLATELRALGTQADEAERLRLEAEALAVESRIGAYQGDDEFTVRVSDAALALLGSGDDALRADLLLSLGWIRRRQGDLPASTSLFDQAARLGRRAGAAQAALWGTRYLALDWLTLGRLRDAAVLIEDELARIGEGDEFCDFARAALLVGRAEIAYERNTLDESWAAVEEALAIAHRAADAKVLMNAYVARVWLDRACGDLDAAQEAALRAHRLMNGSNEAALQAFLALDRGNLATAMQWAESTGACIDAPASSVCDTSPIAVVACARLQAASGNGAGALALLQRADREWERRGWVRPHIVARVWYAVFSAEAGLADQAEDAAVEAIRLATPEGYVRCVLEPGRAIKPILREALRSRRLSEAERTHALAILGASTRDGDRSAGAVDGDSPLLVERLTERQSEILALLATGRSNREIAEALYVAEGTVKAHVHQIYGKLMASNRLEAVAHARQLGLLND